MKRPLHIFLLVAVCSALFVTQASALEYSIGAPDDYLFARPTSEDTICEWENPNIDRSKNTAVVAPNFGMYTSFLPGNGEYLTTSFVSGALGVGTNQAESAGDVSAITGGYPVVNIGASYTAAAYTEVTSNLYYSNGSLGTVSIPSLGLTMNIYEGTDSATLAKGVGHFVGSSIWSGNVALAAHNRGVNAYFGQIHTLSAGNTITLTTKLGTRTYAVTSVEKLLETDTSGLDATAGNCITLYTCVRDQPAYRWCVKGVEI